LNEEEDDDGDKVISKTLLLRLQNGKLSKTDSTICRAYACTERNLPFIAECLIEYFSFLSQSF